MSQEKTERSFDHESYWLKRHEELRGNWASVGRLALTDEENRANHAAFMASVRACRERLFSSSQAPLKVLDLACGVGRLAPVFVEAGDDYLGIDISPIAVEQAREFCPAAQFEVGSITSFRTDQPYDFVIASYVIVHMVDQSDWNAALTTLRQSVKDDGAILLMDVIPERTDILSSYAVRRSRAEFEQALTSLGMRFTDELSGLSLPEYHVIRAHADK